jgi:N-formylglutamate amidohydrolase
MVENQRRTDAALLDIQAGLRDVNRRVDRLYYVILGMGAAVIAATFASRFLGG